MKWLAEKGYAVVGCDIVELAAVQFFTENDIPYKKCKERERKAKKRLENTARYCVNVHTVAIAGLFHLSNVTLSVLKQKGRNIVTNENGSGLSIGG